MQLEREILHQISQVAANAPSLDWALEEAARLFEDRLGGRTLAVNPVSTADYVAPLVDHGREVGRLAAGFEDSPLDAAALRRILVFAGEQLGSVAGRDALRHESCELRSRIERMQETLRVDKLLARAKGLLASRLSLRPDIAERQLIERAQKSGRPVAQIAESVVALYTEARSLTA